MIYGVLARQMETWRTAR